MTSPGRIRDPRLLAARWARPLLVAGLCSWLVAGCSSAPTAPAVRQGGTLSVALDADPASLNPLVANDPVSAQAYAPLFPLLYRANADLSVGPDLAAAMPALAASGTAVTVQLRGDAKWSDGMPITADDLVYTVTTEMSPALATHAVFHWSDVKSVTKVNALTVKFTLTAPDAAFVADSLVTPIVPQHVLAKVPPAQMAANAFSSAPSVTGGPFKFNHRVAGTAIYLDANPSYFLGNPHIDHVVENVVQDRGQIVNQLENGKLSWAPALTGDQAASAASAPGLTISAYPNTSLDAVMFNVRPGRVFADKAVRQAFAYSIDHDTLAAQATGNAPGYSVWGDINPFSWAFDQGVAATYAPDSGRAHRLLTQDGWSVPSGGVASNGGRTLTAQIIYPSTDPSRASAASMIARDTLINGFALAPTGQDAGTFAASLSSGNFDVAVVSLPTGLDPDDSAFLGSHGAENYGGYSNPALDEVLGSELAATAQSGQNLQQVRKPLFDHVEQIVSADLPLYFLWVPRAFTGFNAVVNGVAGVGAQLVADRADSFYRDWYLSS